MATRYQQASRRRTYRVGIALALIAAFVTAWTTIVRDDGNGIGFLAVIMAAGVAGLSSRFRPDGMAGGMVGVAIMQIAIGVAVATAPSTAVVPGGSARMLAVSGIYSALWLLSAACFRTAARMEREAAVSR
jgi:hypothetical protein